jgi:hypothetical protein
MSRHEHLPNPRRVLAESAEPGPVLKKRMFGPTKG